MRIGRMDRRIVIETPTVSNTKGSISQSWATLATVWAGVIDRAGTESPDGDEIVAVRTLTFRVRYRTDVTEKMRIRYPSGGSNYYDIASVHQVGRREALDIMARAQVG